MLNKGLPETLYRGDKKGDRLKALKNNYLFTNLISGGIGQDIFKNQLIDLVKKHISPGWEKTHFLSFTEKKEKAIEFGSHDYVGEPFSYIEDGDKWDFAIIEFDTKKLHKSISLENGVYKCFYSSTCTEFNNGCEIILINTIEYLKSNVSLGIENQIINAKRDSEWILIPFNSILLNNGKTEYSAKLCMADVFTFELFEMLNHQNL